MGEVSVTLNPVFVGIPNDGFRGRTNDEFFFQFGIGIGHEVSGFIGIGFEAIVGYHGAFLGESFSIFFFFFEQAFGHKQREIGIHVTCFFEHVIELSLHFFPNGIAIGFDDHTTFNGTVFS